MLPFSVISCVHSYAIVCTSLGDVAWEREYLIRESPGHNFVSGLHTLKPKKLFKKLEKPKS